MLNPNKASKNTIIHKDIIIPFVLDIPISFIAPKTTFSPQSSFNLIKLLLSFTTKIISFHSSFIILISLSFSGKDIFSFFLIFLYLKSMVQTKVK